MSDHAISNAQGWAETIEWLYECWKFGQGEIEGRDMSHKGKRTLRYEFDYGDKNGRDNISEAVEEYARESILSLEVRTDWHNPCDEDTAPTEYYLLLSTGGPALRIIGGLNHWCEPEDAELQWQDWGTPWTEFKGDVDSDALMWFASLFWYGEAS